MTVSGKTLYLIWEKGREHGLSQRKLASFLGESFNSIHGKIWREQQKFKVIEMKGPYTEINNPVKFKAVVFDLETSDFTAGGYVNNLICMSYFDVQKEELKSIHLKFGDVDDKDLVKLAADTLAEYDILIGHNIIAFDLNWLNSRLMYHGLGTVPKRWLYYDTYLAARRMAIKADRKSLAMLCDFFRVPYVKTAVNPVLWSMVNSHNEDEFNEAINEIVYHCEEDVKSNWLLFNVLWRADKFMMNLPFTKR